MAYSFDMMKLTGRILDGHLDHSKLTHLAKIQHSPTE